VKVVILTTTRLSRTKGAEDAVRRWADAGDDVRLVTMFKHDDPWPLAEVVVVGAPSTGGRLGRPGRALVRVFPGPVARQMASKVKGSPAARTALDAADLVVAADPAAVRTAWWSSRRHPSVPHVSGLTPALQQSKR
jgi:hypothetical protein